LRSPEKKSFITIFSISFTSLFLFGCLIAYSYYEENKDHIERDILYQMKEYAFDFKDKKFSLDIIKASPEMKFFKMYQDDKILYSFFRFPKDDTLVLKVIYKQENFKEDLKVLIYKTIVLSSLAIVFIFIFSSVFAFYAIKPMKQSIDLLENFLKDLIHDLHTPVTSILLNTNLLARREKSEELERIELSAKTITSLYKNLETLQQTKNNSNEPIALHTLIEEKIKVLKKLYPSIQIKSNVHLSYVQGDQISISRIIDNIVTNACKYNKKNGKVFIEINGKELIIKDTGIGIKNPHKIFDKYYKENERGLGLGMNIVKRLCIQENIAIEIKSELSKGTTVKLIFN